MKIALVSPYDLAHPGGVSEHVLALAKWLMTRGHNATIIAACSQPRVFQQAYVRPVSRAILSVSVGGTVARVGISPLIHGRLKKAFLQDRYDVIHLHEPLVPGINWYALMLASGLSESVTVGTFHANHEDSDNLYRLGEPILQRLFRKLDRRIAVSDVAYRYANRLFPGQYTVIPNGIDLDRFSKRGEPQANRPLTILFVGRQDKRKGFDILFQAFLQITATNPRLRLLVVGPISDETRLSYLKMAHLRDVTAIEFTGYVPPQRLPHYYHQADIFCAPSTGYESFGIILLEAMAAGLPVVASDIAGYRTLVAGHGEGLLVPPGRPEALANALHYLIEQPIVRQKMGQAGRQKAENYSWALVVDDVIDVYQDALAEARRSVCLSLGQTAPLRHGGV
jgi:phosphatidylinositol alpha-mannosyltransferase